MRKSFRFRRKFRRGPEPPRYRINRKITAPQVRVIGAEGENVGVLDTEEAVLRAEALGLDLIEVSPKAEPPVAKIMSYGSFKYQEEKQKAKQKAKQKKVEIKGIRLSFQIGAHDRDIRLKKAQEFFDDGDKVKVELLLRGRQRQHTDLARELMEKFIVDLGENILVESPLMLQGGKFLITVARKPTT